MRRSDRPCIGPDEVVTAAVAVAFDAGLYGVTLEAVAAHLRISRRAVVRVQADEQRLVADAFDRIARGELAETKRIVLANPSPAHQLRILLEVIAEPSGVEMDIIWAQSWSLGQSNQVLGAMVRGHEAAWHSLVASVVRRGVKFDDFFAVDADEFAAQILAICAGVNAYSLVGYRSDVDRMHLITSLVRAELGVKFDAADLQARAREV